MAGLVSLRVISKIINLDRAVVNFETESERRQQWLAYSLMKRESCPVRGGGTFMVQRDNAVLGTYLAEV